MPRSRPGLSALVLLLAAPWPGPVAAQEPERSPDTPRWNGRRAVHLVQRARDRRREPVVDSALTSYRADVTGHIYFFLDREAEGEPVLLRADQVALELYWSQPDRTKQVIRGMRSEEQFPIKNFQYYLDRYTVIQNGFGDVIRVGEGRDVRNVLHPLAPVAGAFYDYRLADSVTIRLPAGDTLRVYEVQVRPKDFGVPAIIGSLFLERTRGDLVRLTFTFTPSSYIDPRNERVEIMLENALWEGRYWLPREQRLLVRREIPELDLDVGTVIRAALRVTDYELNPDLPARFFDGREVIAAAGPRGLASYDFDEGLYDGFDDVGLAPGASPGTLDAVDVDAIAGRILRQTYLRGVSRVRFYAPTASDVVRFDRAEGLVTGAGVSLGLARSQLFGYVGYAWGSRDPVAEAGWRPTAPDGRPTPFVRVYVNRPRDLGLRPAAAGVLSTLSAALAGQDFRDVVPASGAALGIGFGEARSGRTVLRLEAEHHRVAVQAESDAPLTDGNAFRPVPPAVESWRWVGAVDHARPVAVGGAVLTLRPSLELGVLPALSETVPDAAPSTELGLDGAGQLRLRLDADLTWSDARRRSGVDARLTGALGAGRFRPQDLWLLGGRNTLPGHPFHAYAGSRAATADVVAWRTLVPRFLRLRLLAAAGWSDMDGAPPVPPAADGLEPWTPVPTGGVRSGLGLGLGFLDGFVRLDWVRADTGDGSLMLSLDPRLWSFL